MESKDKEEYVYLICKYDINRCEEEEKNSVGQKEETEHLARIIIFSIEEEVVYPTYSNISDEGTQKSYKEEY